MIALSISIFNADSRTRHRFFASSSHADVNHEFKMEPASVRLVGEFWHVRNLRRDRLVQKFVFRKRFADGQNEKDETAQCAAQIKNAQPGGLLSGN